MSNTNDLSQIDWRKTFDKALSSNPIMLLFFVIIALFAYSNSINNGTSLDDFLVINTTTLKGIHAIKDIFTYNFDRTGSMGDYGYRPIVLLSYAIQIELFGESLAAAHLVNILLHAFNAYLLFLICSHLFPQYRHLLAWGAIGFLIHPINAEVVNNLKSRDELLALFFGLLCIITVCKFSITSNISFLLLAFVCILTALLAKKTAILIIPFGLIIAASKIQFDQAKLNWRKIVAVCIAIASAYILYKYLVNLYETVETAHYSYENPIRGKGVFLERILYGFHIIGRYLQLLCYPHPLRFYYGADLIPLANAYTAKTALAILLFAASVLFAFVKYKTHTFIATIILAFTALLLIISGIVKLAPGVMAERFAYLCSFFFCTLVGYSILSIKKPAKYANYLHLTLFCIISSLAIAKTHQRNSQWENLISLTKADMPYLENTFKGNQLYAASRLFYADTLKKDNFQDIKQHYQKALQLQPQHVGILSDMGTLHYAAKKYQQATQYFETVDSININKLNPQAKTAYNIAITADSLHQFNKTIEYYKKTILRQPANQYATKAYQRLMQLADNAQPNDALFIIDQCAQAYYLVGDHYKAISIWENALDKNPKNAALLYKLTQAYAEMGDTIKSNYYKNK